jgi:hypothetical protein
MTPRPGLKGVWDRLVGPGMTPGENYLVLSSGILGALIAGISFAWSQIST